MKQCILLVFMCIISCFGIAREENPAKLTADEYIEKGDYAQALKSCILALQKAENRKDYAMITTLELKIGRCHYYLRDISQAIVWFDRARATAEQHKLNRELADAYYLLGAMYIEQEKVDSAEKYSYKAIEMFEHNKDYSQLSKTYSTLAELHLNTSKDPSKIELNIKNALFYAQLSHDERAHAFAAKKQFNYLFYHKRKYREALMYVTTAEQNYKKAGVRKALIDLYKDKAACLIYLKDTNAIIYMDLWLRSMDSLMQFEKAEGIAKYETLYETEKKVRENRILQKANELKEQKILSKNKTIVLFIVLVILIMAISLLLIARLSLKKKKQELTLMKQLHDDKERIARDLHDNVGGQLSYMIYALDGITSEDEQTREEVSTSLNSAVKSVISNLRETIWAISDESIRVEDLSDKLKVYTKMLFEHSEIKVLFKEEIKLSREFSPLQGLNLYRICQEVLHNTFKHAEAGEVNISIAANEHQIRVCISDNGIGFDNSINKTDSFGLENIRRRAAEFGIQVKVLSAPAHGTYYELLV